MLKRDVSVEQVVQIHYRPQAIFRIRPVARCSATMEGACSAELHTSQYRLRPGVPRRVRRMPTTPHRLMHEHASVRTMAAQAAALDAVNSSSDETRLSSTTSPGGWTVHACRP